MTEQRGESHSSNVSTLTPEGYFRNIPWQYLGPVFGAPIPHIFVSLMNKYPQHKKKMLQAVIWTSVLAVVTRLVLMNDAGYPGHERLKDRPKS